jgi:enoyl-CoA hydratase/carnithine racemase
MPVLPALQTVLYELDDEHVASVTINRPEAMNSFDDAMMNDFDAIWAHVAQEDAVHAVVLRAAPGRAFSTGVDVKQPSPLTALANVWSRTDPGDRLGPKRKRCWKPVIAAVHGLCAGGAFYWLNECDIIICSEDAQFFDPHVTYGMVAAVEPIGLRYRIPLGETLRMALMGNDERIGAPTALRIGLVSEVTTSDELWGRAAQIARTIAAKPAAAVQGTVRAIWESLELPRSAALQMALNYSQIGNPIGKAAVNREALMKGSKSYKVR